MSPERKARIQALLEPFVSELHLASLEALTTNERSAHEMLAVKVLSYSALLERKAGRGGQHQAPVTA